jgi:hypothetical protein
MVVRDLCKTPLFARFLHQAQILILEILNVFVWLKLSPSLNSNKNRCFAKVSVNEFVMKNNIIDSNCIVRLENNNTVLNAECRIVKLSVFKLLRLKQGCVKGKRPDVGGWRSEVGDQGSGIGGKGPDVPS